LPSRHSARRFVFRRKSRPRSVALYNRDSADFPGKRRQATACWEGGRNSLLESAQEATLLSVATSANQRQLRRSAVWDGGRWNTGGKQWAMHGLQVKGVKKVKKVNG
jgi:hypothetical protein